MHRCLGYRPKKYYSPVRFYEFLKNSKHLPQHLGALSSQSEKILKALVPVGSHGDFERFNRNCSIKDAVDAVHYFSEGCQELTWILCFILDVTDTVQINSNKTPDYSKDGSFQKRARQIHNSKLPNTAYGNEVKEWAEEMETHGVDNESLPGIHPDTSNDAVIAGLYNEHMDEINNLRKKLDLANKNLEEAETRLTQRLNTNNESWKKTVADAENNHTKELARLHTALEEDKANILANHTHQVAAAPDKSDTSRLEQELANSKANEAHIWNTYKTEAGQLKAYIKTLEDKKRFLDQRILGQSTELQRLTSINPDPGQLQTYRNKMHQAQARLIEEEANKKITAQKHQAKLQQLEEDHMLAVHRVNAEWHRHGVAAIEAKVTERVRDLLMGHDKQLEEMEDRHRANTAGLRRELFHCHVDLDGLRGEKDQLLRQLSQLQGYTSANSFGSGGPGNIRFPGPQKE